MFLITEAEADAIRDAFNRDGELSAIIELRRFPGITDYVKARDCARNISGWQRGPRKNDPPNKGL